MGALTSGCEGPTDQPAIVAFEIDWGNESGSEFIQKWNEASASDLISIPAHLGVTTSTPGLQVRLYLGRSTEIGSPLVVGGDVLLTDELLVSIETLDDNGQAQFGPFEA